MECLVHAASSTAIICRTCSKTSAAFPGRTTIPNIVESRHVAMAGRILTAVEDFLIQQKPDWALVFGDTSSTLAGTLPAAKRISAWLTSRPGFALSTCGCWRR